MTAKLRIDSIETNEWSDNLKMSAVCGNTKDGKDEDNTFSQATPSASLTLCISNPDLRGKFKPGQKFYVDFREAIPAMPGNDRASA